MISRIRPRAFTALFALVSCIGLAFLLLRPPRPVATSGWAAEEHPSLFHASEVCPNGWQSEERASRLEHDAHLHADRYSFDPADGVRAVHAFLVARECYLNLGLSDDARRVALLASTLAGRVEADYASSRTILASSVASEQWRVALEEARRLLRFTAHLPAGLYVEWLHQVLGKAASRASY